MELTHDGGSVSLHRLDADAKNIGYLPVCVTLRYQLQDRALPIGEG